MIGSLALATLRTRKAAFAGSFLALLCAAALVAACGVLLETGLRGGVPTERYAGTPIVVAADQSLHWTKEKKGKTKVKSKPLTERARLDAAVADRLRAVPGIAAVVPEVTFPATVLERSSGDEVWGHAWDSARLTPFTLRAGRAPVAADEVVLGSTDGVRVTSSGGTRVGEQVTSTDGVSVGAQVTIQATGVPGRYRVVGLADGGPESVFFSAAEARRLAGHDGKVTALGVLPRAGADTDALAEAVTAAVAGTGAEVYTGKERGALEFRDAEQARVMLISLGGALGGTSLLVAILVVVGTFALSIQQRQREIAVLRAVAATPRQIRKMIGREALAVGAAASVPGAFVGLGLAFWLRSRFVELGALPDTLDLSLSPFPVFAAVLATVAAAWTAARVSSRRTIRIRPTEALADAAVEPSRVGVFRTIAGLVALAAYIVLLVVLRGLNTEAAASPVTFLTVVLAAVAVALLGPWLTRAATAVLAAPLRLSRGPGFLAAANTRADARRLASVVTPMTLAVAMTGTILFVQTTMDHAADEQARAGTTAGYALTGVAGVPGPAADAARKVPGVGAVTEVVHTTLRVGRDKYPAQGIGPARGTLDLDVREGSLDHLAAGTVALSATAAERRDTRIGDSVTITMGDGVKVTARLVAVYERGLGFGDVTLPYELVAGHVDRPPADTVLIKADPSAHPALAEIARAMPGLRLLDGDALHARSSNAAEVNLVAMGLIIAFTAISLVNTLAMATGDRSRELAALRLAGTTRRQILRMLRWETLLLVLVGTVTGTAIAAATLSAFATGMAGTPVPYAPPLACLGLLAAVTAAALAATALPARVLLRADPADVIRARE